MVSQQFGGINGIGFYASETFAEAGKIIALNKLEYGFCCYSFLLKTYVLPIISTAGLSGNIGTIAYACVQVHNYSYYPL